MSFKDSRRHLLWEGIFRDGASDGSETKNDDGCGILLLPKCWGYTLKTDLIVIILHPVKSYIGGLK